MFDISTTLYFSPCSREKYLQKIASSQNPENAILIHTENGTPYLIADIECGGEINLRVELFSEIYSDGFCLVNSDLSIDENISELVAECRGYYVGGICFIEYKSYGEAEEHVYEDFINTHDEGSSPIYLTCRENALSHICSFYPNADIFLWIEKGEQ